MAHTRASTKARQVALDEMFVAIAELEGVVTEAESRDQRMTGADSAKAKETRERFSAFGSAR